MGGGVMKSELPIIGYALRKAWSGGGIYIMRLHSETPKTAQATECWGGGWGLRPSRVNKDDFLVRVETEAEARALAAAAKAAWDAHESAVLAAQKALRAAQDARHDAWRAALSTPSRAR